MCLLDPTAAVARFWCNGIPAAIRLDVDKGVDATRRIVRDWAVDFHVISRAELPFPLVKSSWPADPKIESGAKEFSLRHPPTLRVARSHLVWSVVGNMEEAEEHLANAPNEEQCEYAADSQIEFRAGQPRGGRRQADG